MNERSTSSMHSDPNTVLPAEIVSTTCRPHLNDLQQRLRVRVWVCGCLLPNTLDILLFIARISVFVIDTAPRGGWERLFFRAELTAGAAGFPDGRLRWSHDKLAILALRRAHPYGCHGAYHVCIPSMLLWIRPSRRKSFDESLLGHRNRTLSLSQVEARTADTAYTLSTNAYTTSDSV